MQQNAVIIFDIIQRRGDSQSQSRAAHVRAGEFARSFLTSGRARERYETRETTRAEHNGAHCLRSLDAKERWLLFGLLRLRAVSSSPTGREMGERVHRLRRSAFLSAVNALTRVLQWRCVWLAFEGDSCGARIVMLRSFDSLKCSRADIKGGWVFSFRLPSIVSRLLRLSWMLSLALQRPTMSVTISRSAKFRRSLQ